MPARARDVVRAAKELGLSVEEPSSGSHWKFTDGTETFPIPLHNGLKTEIGDKYLKALCRRFGIEFDSLLKKL